MRKIIPWTLPRISAAKGTPSELLFALSELLFALSELLFALLHFRALANEVRTG